MQMRGRDTRSGPRPLRLSPAREHQPELWSDSSDVESIFAAVVRPPQVQESEGASTSRPVQNAEGNSVDLLGLQLADFLRVDDEGKWLPPKRPIKISGRPIGDLTCDDIFPPFPSDAPETPLESEKDEDEKLEGC